MQRTRHVCPQLRQDFTAKTILLFWESGRKVILVPLKARETICSLLRNMNFHFLVLNTEITTTFMLSWPIYYSAFIFQSRRKLYFGLKIIEKRIDCRAFNNYYSISNPGRVRQHPSPGKTVIIPSSPLEYIVISSIIKKFNNGNNKTVPYFPGNKRPFSLSKETKTLLLSPRLKSSYFLII